MSEYSSRVYVFTDYGGPEYEQLIERPQPTPGPDELAVQVHAAGVNPADWKLREGRFGRRHRLPAAFGFEVSGVVVAVGDGVAGVVPGDAVLGPPTNGWGGYADHTLLAAADAVAKPDVVSFEAAATLPVAGTTAYDLIHQVDLQSGQQLVIVGAGGGVGMMATQLAVLRDLDVIGVAGEAKRNQVTALGATFVPSGDGFVDRVRPWLTSGAHLVVDLVGGATLRQAATLAADPWRVVSAADPDVTDLGGSTRQRNPEALQTLTSYVGQGLVDPNVTASYPLQDARDALARVEAGHATGKTVLRPN